MLEGKIKAFLIKHRLYFIFIFLLCFILSFWNLINYTYALYVMETKETYDIRDLKEGDTIPFDAHLIGQFFYKHFVGYGYGLGSNSIDSFSILYCEDKDCTDGYLLADSFNQSYQVKNYKEVFGEENENFVGWNVAFLENKEEYYDNSFYAYVTKLNRDLILYPSESETYCCPNPEEKIYEFTKLEPVIKKGDWEGTDDLYHETSARYYPNELSLVYRFTAEKAGILTFDLLTDLMNFAVTINGQRLLYTDFDYIYNNGDTYQTVQYEVTTPGDYELKLYLDNYLDSLYVTYVGVKNVMYLEETTDNYPDERDIIVVSTCPNSKTCVLGATTVAVDVPTDDVEEPEVEKEEEKVDNPDTLDSIFISLSLCLIFAMCLAFFITKMKYIKE